MNQNKFYVYALSDPINRKPFYIGKGSGNRAYQHLNRDKVNRRKRLIIDNLKIIGLMPIVTIIMNDLNEKDAYSIEYLLIKNSKYYNVDLVNVVGIKIPPSRKGCSLSKETKLKISLSSKGKSKQNMSNETKSKISSKNKGKLGPNKVYIDDIQKLKELYTVSNYTKKQLCEFFSIGLGSLNRILNENGIRKL